MNMELMVMRWLWIQQRCHYVCEQRCPRYFCGSPDVIGVTRSRYVTEIEIKRSLSDFKADSDKWHRKNRDLYLKQQPRLFYYAVPVDLVEKVKPLLPEWAGLLKCNPDLIEPVVEVDAPVNKLSKRLEIKECVKLARQMVSHMMTHATRNHTHTTRFIDRDDLRFVDWTEAENGTYQI